MCGVTRRGSVLCLESERIPNPCAINYFELDSQLFSLEVNLEFGLIEKWQRLKCGGKWDSLCATFIIISFFLLLQYSRVEYDFNHMLLPEMNWLDRGRGFIFN